MPNHIEQQPTNTKFVQGRKWLEWLFCCGRNKGKLIPLARKATLWSWFDWCWQCRCESIHRRFIRHVFFLSVFAFFAYHLFVRSLFLTNFFIFSQSLRLLRIRIDVETHCRWKSSQIKYVNLFCYAAFLCVVCCCCAAYSIYSAFGASSIQLRIQSTPTQTEGFVGKDDDYAWRRLPHSAHMALNRGAYWCIDNTFSFLSYNISGTRSISTVWSQYKKQNEKQIQCTCDECDEHNGLQKHQFLPMRIMNNKNISLLDLF